MSLSQDNIPSLRIGPSLTGAPSPSPIISSLHDIGGPRAPDQERPRYSAAFVRGQHTPGYILDDGEVYLPANPGAKIEPGLLAVLVDGVTNRGTEVWQGRKQIASRRDLEGGLVVEEFLANFKANLDPRLGSEPAFNPKALSSGDARTVITLINWLLPSGSGPTYDTLHRLSAVLVRPELSLNDNLFLRDHGMRISRVGELESIGGEGIRLAPGFRRTRYQSFWSGEFLAEKLDSETLAYLSRFSPHEIAAKIFNLPEAWLAAQVACAVDRTTLDLKKAFLENFGSLERAYGGLAIAGLLRLKDNGGIALFGIGDSLAGVIDAERGIRTTAVNSRQGGIALYPGISIGKNGTLVEQVCGISVIIVPECQVAGSTFFLASDGFSCAEESPAKFISALRGYTDSAAQLVERATNYGREHDLELANGNRSIDDKSIIAIDGSRLTLD